MAALFSMCVAATRSAALMGCLSHARPLTSIFVITCSCSPSTIKATAFQQRRASCTQPAPTVCVLGQQRWNAVAKKRQPNLLSSPLFTQKAYLFTNAKKSFARGTEEELRAREEAEKKASYEFLARKVDGDGRNAPCARDVESQLPTKKQLNEELPSAAELEKALKEGKIDMFVTKPEKDDD